MSAHDLTVKLFLQVAVPGARGEQEIQVSVTVTFTLEP
jgi:uncharacterized protein YggE